MRTTDFAMALDQKGARLTGPHESGQAARGGELSPAQVLFKLAAGAVQFCLVLAQLLSAKADFAQIIVDFSPVPKDFFFAGSVADVPA